MSTVGRVQGYSCSPMRNKRGSLLRAHNERLCFYTRIQAHSGVGCAEPVAGRGW